MLWPSSSEVHSAVAERIHRLLDEHGGLVADFGRRTMSVGHGVLSDDPHSFIAVLIPGACLTAGADWHAALWPAAAAEYMMAAADLFDDVADADPGTVASDSPGVALTAAAGLLSLAGVAVVRVTEDGAAPATALALADLLGAEFSRAANGQAANLQPERTVDTLTAYLQAAAKSGSLGSLIARLGARTATNNAEIVDLLTTAEGIEERSQWTMLEKLGCDQGQGFVFSRPLKPFDVEALLAAETAGERMAAA